MHSDLCPYNRMNNVGWLSYSEAGLCGTATLGYGLYQRTRALLQAGCTCIIRSVSFIYSQSTHRPSRLVLQYVSSSR